MKTKKDLKRPTGFTPSSLPFHKLDAGAFEQFCTELLNLNPEVLCLRNKRASRRRIVSATRLLGGTDQKGADIRAEAQQGEVWFFQCKHRSEMGPAKVREALDLAERELPQADQFVLVTTCGLSPDAQSLLHERGKWLWWDAPRLTTEVLRLRPRENAINLIHRFFGPEEPKQIFTCSVQPLLHWREFFAQDLSSDRHFFHHRLPFVPWGDAISRLEEFARTGAGRALIMSGTGGQGKSRLILELAQKLEKGSQAPRVRFLNLNRQGLDSEQLDFIAREEEDLLLVVDDAHRLDAALEGIVQAAASAEKVRLLVATRPQAFEVVRSRLYQNGYAERLESSLHLSRWSQKEIVALAEHVLKPENRVQAARLAGLADRCPLLVVLGGALINSGGWPEAMTNEDAFRERVYRSFKQDFLNQQPEAKRERIDRLIRLLSFVCPTPKSDIFLDEVSAILGCSALEVGDDLEALQAAGMLAENREGIRLYPDLFADAVLLDAAVDGKGGVSPLCKTILAKLQINEFPSLMLNLAQADWSARAKKSSQVSLFEPVWKSFVDRFKKANWPDYSGRFVQRLQGTYRDKSQESAPDRDELLGQWASFAVYLPERTIELCELALTLIKSESSPESSTSSSPGRASVNNRLPALLKPIAIWHHDHAERALDLLWALEAEEPKFNENDSSNPIIAIAQAGSFALNKPLKTSETVVEWLQRKVLEPTTISRLQEQPWILAALLKPFFGRDIEHSWSTGRTIHFSSIPIRVDVTREVRGRALRLVERFITSNDLVLCHAVIPVLQDAIHPVTGRWRRNPEPGEHAAWQPERIQVVTVIEKALQVHRDSPVTLLDLRKILRSRCEYESDNVIRDECHRVITAMPNTFELRVARVLTSWAHDEISVKPGEEFKRDLDEAEKQWLAFRRSVATEVTQRYNTAGEVCSFLRDQVRRLAAAKKSVLAGALLDVIAELSPKWCGELLHELITSTDGALDGFLWPLLHRSASVAPGIYGQAMEVLPKTGRPEQVCSLISYMGWKQLHGGGLDALEKQSILESTLRGESEVLYSIASVAGLHFANNAELAMEVLSRIPVNDDRVGKEVIEALSRLVDKHQTSLDSEDVARILANVGDYCFPETTSDERHLDTIAEGFPKQVYEHVRAMHERGEANPNQRHWRAETLSLGVINDDDYVNREIRSLWQQSRSVKPDTFSEYFRTALIRALIRTDTTKICQRVQELIACSEDGADVERAAEIAATAGSRFVFEFPDIVRLFLIRGKELGNEAGVLRVLWLSACGGGRSFTDNELDPEYRYILEQAEGLANKYRNDSTLGRFYEMIAKSERETIARDRRAFASDEELD